MKIASKYILCELFCKRASRILLRWSNILRLDATETKKWWSLYSCELRRFLGGATHFASFHEALAEQSASFVLPNKLADTN